MPNDAADPVRVLVTGSRTWNSYRTIATALDTLHRVHGGRLVIVHGACPTGADAIAAAWCRRHAVPQEPHRADWRTHGRAAGPVRNAAMVHTRPALCLAFIRDASRGASHCADLADRTGIPIRRYRHATGRSS
ncbi:MAG: DUF2493 domain-containing protein [Stackebrandtia sp.]